MNDFRRDVDVYAAMSVSMQLMARLAEKGRYRNLNGVHFDRLVSTPEGDVLLDQFIDLMTEEYSPGWGPEPSRDNIAQVMATIVKYGRYVWSDDYPRQSSSTQEAGLEIERYANKSEMTTEQVLDKITRKGLRFATIEEVFAGDPRSSSGSVILGTSLESADGTRCGVIITFGSGYYEMKLHAYDQKWHEPPFATSFAVVRKNC